MLNYEMTVTQENDSGFLVRRNSRKLSEIWVLIYISTVGKIRFVSYFLPGRRNRGFTLERDMKFHEMSATQPWVSPRAREGHQNSKFSKTGFYPDYNYIEHPKSRWNLANSI